MSGLIKMQLDAYADNMFSGRPTGTMNILVNPENYQLTKNIGHSENKELGNQGSSVRFNKYENQELSFTVYFDGTGVIPGTSQNTVVDYVKQFDALVYNNNSKIHQPNYVQISWGSLIFQGQLSKYTLHYTLFSPEGIPLRVKIDLTFTQSISKTFSASWSEKGELLTEKVELKEGDSISSLCYSKYKNSKNVRNVARANNLDSFRKVKPGSSIILPKI